MQQVADVADVEAGARADFLVGQLFVELEANQFPAAVVEGFQAEPHQADAFPAGDLLIRQRLRVGSVIGGRRPRVAGRDQGHDLAGLPPVVQRQVVHGAIEPSPRLAHLAKLCMQSHERFLDYVLGGAGIAGQAQRIAQEGRFQGCKQLLDRFPSRRFRAGLVWWH